MAMYPNPFGYMRQSLRGGTTPVPVLPKLAAAIARVKAGTAGARAIHMMIGDSTTRGFGAGTAVGSAISSGSTAGSTNYRQNKSAAHKLAEAWAAAGVPSRSDAVFGNGSSTNNTTAEYAAANGQISFGSGVIIANHTNSEILAGKGGFQFNNTTLFLSFTPEFPADRFEIWFQTGVSGPSFTVTDASGTLATVSTAAAANGVDKVTVVRTQPSTTPISIQLTAAAVATIDAIIPYDTTVPRLEVWNMGGAGWTCANFLKADAPRNPGNRLASLRGVDFATINLGLNDKFYGATVSEFQSNLTALANLVKGTGAEIALIKPHTTPATSDSYYMGPEWFPAYDAASAAAGIASPVNMRADLALVVPGDYYDRVHLSEQGYAKVGNYLRSVLVERSGL